MRRGPPAFAALPVGQALVAPYPAGCFPAFPGLDKLCDYIIAIVCESKEARIRRITVRDRLTRNQAEARIDAQPNNDFYESRADFVIHNELYYKYYKLINDVQKVVYKIKRKVREKQEKKEEV